MDAATSHIPIRYINSTAHRALHSLGLAIIVSIKSGEVAVDFLNTSHRFIHPSIHQTNSMAVTNYQEVYKGPKIVSISTDPFKRVYSLLLQIPAGRVTTYKALSDALQSSPRAIGGALRNNPFAPEVVSVFPPFDLLATRL